MKPSDSFQYNDECFADIQMLRYRLNGFEQLSLRQKIFIYCLSQATLYGRDITFDQFGKYNLKIRKTLEAIFLYYKGNRECEDFKSFITYLKRVWFSNGIYHHYGNEKIIPDFSQTYFQHLLQQTPVDRLPIGESSLDAFCEELIPVMFSQELLAKKVDTREGIDVVVSSACNYYEGVTQKEVEDFYASQKDTDDTEPPSYGLNTTLVKDHGVLKEVVWKVGGKYGKAIEQIVYWLEKSLEYAENDSQKQYIQSLIKYYQTGDLRIFNQYCIEWVGEHQSAIDFVNGFIEVYSDPMGLKGSWEGIVEYRDEEATKRTRTISDNAQWFEDHSPVDPHFRKPHVKGVVANVINAAMLGGDEYPSTAIGINLPNADWIRAEYGSKSITIGNLIDAYNKAAHGSGFREAFIEDQEVLAWIEKYGDQCDDLHTDLHECLGHGSGQLLPGTDPDALKSYGSTIEEARADLFALYYIADKKLVDLGLLSDENAYQSQYYTYILNGLMTQLVRIKPGAQLEEAHMRNRAIIARWCYEKGKDQGVIEMYEGKDGHYIRINDYHALRQLFAQLLAEIQRIKSEGDFPAAQRLVEDYAVHIDPDLHQEILQRYERLHLAPYKGFINPVLSLVRDNNGHVSDVSVDYSETYEHQMLRYSSDYATLI